MTELQLSLQTPGPVDNSSGGAIAACIQCNIRTIKAATPPLHNMSGASNCTCLHKIFLPCARTVCQR